MSVESGELIMRPATPRDAAALAALLRSNGWHKIFELETAGETDRIVARHLELCLTDRSHSITVACDAQGQIVGYVAVHWLPYLFLSGPEGFVTELFVDESMQNRGIGTRLLDGVIDEARARGCSRLQLINLRTRQSYARGYYRKQGWNERPEAASFVRILKS